MKQIVLMLVLLNIVFLVWQWIGVQQDGHSTQKGSTGKPLLLFSEHLQQKSKLANTGKQQAPGAVAKKTPTTRVATASTKKSAGSTSQIGQAPDANACFTIGPFALINDVSAASHMFDKAGVSNQQRASSERKQAGFWVYIPPLKSLQAARAVLRDLQNKNLRDALIISGGDKANAISAGVYYVEMHAERRRDAIRKYGYYAKIEELTRTQPQYWLDVELKTSTRIPERLWRQVSKKYSNIGQKKRACE